ncbi:hypothetical protein, partial [Anaerotignum faecicola]
GAAGSPPFYGEKRRKTGLKFSGADCLQDVTGNFKTGLRSKHMNTTKLYEWFFVRVPHEWFS